MLKKIREKPHHIKQRISFLATVIIFSAILFIWISSRDARESGVEIREKTVSPVDGVSVMFDGFVSGIKERFSSSVSEAEKIDSVATTPEDVFDISGVVIIDPTVSGVSTSSSPK